VAEEYCWAITEGRVLLGYNRGGVAVILQQIKFISFGVRVLNGFLRIYIFEHTYL
jgi:hypothetical protein